MAGTKAGGLKARDSILKKYGSDFYQRTGSIGGRACVPKGFALNRQRAVEAGRKGGKISKRGKAI